VVRVLKSGQKVNFKVDLYRTPIWRIVRAMGELISVEVHKFRLVFDGERLHGDDTMADYGIKEGDVILLLINQTGC